VDPTLVCPPSWIESPAALGFTCARCAVESSREHEELGGTLRATAWMDKLAKGRLVYSHII
jgi:hypothetical protein